jgi:hypothetical protein
MLLEYLKEVKDVRDKHGLRYELEYIILFSIFAILSKATGYTDIARFIEEKFEELTDYYNLKWIKPPADTTIGEIIRNIDKASLEERFRKYTEEVLQNKKYKEYDCIAIDGKVLRGSFDNMDNQKPLNLLSTFSTNQDLIFAHFETDSKSNEIPAMQEFIETLGLSGKIFTIDAMHCQKKLLRQ